MMAFRFSVSLSLVALLTVVSVGCSSQYFEIYRQAISQNQQTLQNLQLGMSSEDVRSLMGEGEIVQYKKIYLVDPWRTESFALVDGTIVRILFYVTQPPRKYYQPEDAALTPIVFENDSVVGWGWSFLRQNNERYRIATPHEQR
jgi:Protein of unknown function (DUF3192)